MKKFLIALLFVPLAAFASSTAHLDKWPGSVGDKAALQNGAKIFVNYCLNCHGASYFRYNKLMELGLSEQQVKENLLFTAEKIGEQMRVAARSEEQKQWFGAAPPDLTIIARARASEVGSGADWLYTYLRSFYRDETRPTGWNNVLFDKVAMPHVLNAMQGQQVLNHETHKLELAVPGEQAPAAYDKTVSDLVGFLVWMGEPQQEFRQKLGFFVLAFLALLFVVSYALKKEYWKDIH